MGRLHSILARVDTTSAFQLYQGIRFAVALLIGVLLARSVTDLAVVSAYEHWLWVANLFAFAIYMGFCKSILSYLPGRAVADHPKVVSSTWWLLQGLALVVAVILYLGRATWADWLGIPEFGYWWSSAVLAYLLIGGALLEVLLVFRGRALTLLWWSSLAYSVLLVWAVYAIAVVIDVELFIRGYLCWHATRWLYTAYVSRPISIDPSEVIRISSYSGWLILQMLIGGGMAYVDGLIVNHRFLVEDFAIWRYGARELPLTVIFVAGIATGALPLLRNGGEAALADLRGRVSRLITWLFPLVMLFMIFLPPLFVLIYGTDFRYSGVLFSAFLLVTISRVLMPQVVLQAMQDNAIQVKVSIVEVIINISISLLLIPYLGMLGIIAGSLVAFLFYKVVLIAVLRSRHGIALHQYLPVQKYVLHSLALLCTFVVSYILYAP